MFDPSSIIVGLEIGTSKVCAVVGDLSADNALNIVGLGQSRSRGVRKGEIADVPIAETRTCVRPVSFDGLPLHGPVDGIDGLVLACGHRSHGLTWGPGCGEAIARGILEGEWDPALLPVRLERKVG